MFTAAKPTRLRAGGKKYAIWHHLTPGCSISHSPRARALRLRWKRHLTATRDFDSAAANTLSTKPVPIPDIYRYAIRKMLYVCSPYTVDLYSGGCTEGFQDRADRLLQGGVFSFDGLTM